MNDVLLRQLVQHFGGHFVDHRLPGFHSRLGVLCGDTDQRVQHLIGRVDLVPRGGGEKQRKWFDNGRRTKYMHTLIKC